MITKDAVLMRSFSIIPRDYSFQDDASIQAGIKNLNASFRLISEDGYALYIDAMRIKLKNINLNCDKNAPKITKAMEKSRTNLSPLFETRIFLTICRDVNTSNDKLKTVLFHEEKTETSEIISELTKFKLNTQDMFNMLKLTFLKIEPLDNDSFLTYLHSTFSDTDHKVGTPEVPFYLDTYLADGILIPDTITKYNDDYILSAALHDFPMTTRAGFASRILSLPYEFRMTSRFVFTGKETAKKTMSKYRQAHFQKRKGVGAFLQEAVTKEQTQLQDTEALALTSDSSNAMALLAEGVTYGYLTTTVIVRDKDLARAGKTLEKIQALINDQMFITKRETLNSPTAFLGSIPGNLDFNPRKALISTRNLAHFFPTSVPWSGNYTNEHIRDVEKTLTNENVDYPLLIARTSNGFCPFFLNLNNGDVEHTLVLGPTGAGKSILLNTMAIFFLKYPQSKVVFFDKDKTSEWPCRNAGGVFIEITDDPKCLKFNPFCNIATKDQQAFVAQVVCDYLKDKNITLVPSDEQKIYEAVVQVATLPDGQRSFQTFRDTIQDKDIRAAIDAFVTGEYSDLFNSGKDNIQDTRWLTFEMNWLMNKPAPLVSFMLAYIFHKVECNFGKQPTMLILDEAWLFLANGTFANRIEDWLRTLRKKHVAVIMATQNVADAFKSTIFSTILNACLTKILLPNSRALQPDNIDMYRALGLLDGDIFALQESTPKRHYLFSSSGGKQIFELCLSPKEMAFLKGPYIEIKENN